MVLQEVLVDLFRRVQPFGVFGLGKHSPEDVVRNVPEAFYLHRSDGSLDHFRRGGKVAGGDPLVDLLSGLLGDGDGDLAVHIAILPRSTAVRYAFARSAFCGRPFWARTWLRNRVKR